MGEEEEEEKEKKEEGERRREEEVLGLVKVVNRNGRDILFGHVITIVGVLALSPDSLSVRLVRDVPNYTVIFVKFFLYAVTITIGMGLLGGSSSKRMVDRFIGIGYLGLGAGILWGLSNLAFIMALQNTAVANVLVIMATNPVFSAIASYFLLRERISTRNALTGVVGFIIIALIFSQDMEEKNDSKSTIGIICAVFSSISYGTYFVLIRLTGIRAGVEPDLHACNVLSGIVVSLICLCIDGIPELNTIGNRDLLFLCLQGIFILPIAFTLLIVGPQYISAPEVCLYSFIETVLGPLWVWLGGFEQPPIYALYAGAILIFVLGGNAVLSIRESQTEFQRINTPNRVGVLELFTGTVGDE